MGQLKNLVENAGDKKVYVYLADRAVCRRFLQDAEAEGFQFEDGVKPTARSTSNLYALHKDMTLCYLGYVGHVEFGSPSSPGTSKLCKVDYRDLIGMEKKERRERMTFQDQLRAAYRTKEEAQREEDANYSRKIEAQAKTLVYRIRDALMACAKNGEGNSADGRMTISTEVLLPYTEFLQISRRYENISIFTHRKRVYTTFSLREECQEVISRAAALAREDGIEVVQMHLINKKTGEQQQVPYTSTVYADMTPGARWNLYLTCRTVWNLET